MTNELYKHMERYTISLVNTMDLVTAIHKGHIWSNGAHIEWGWEAQLRRLGGTGKALGDTGKGFGRQRDGVWEAQRRGLGGTGKALGRHMEGVW